MKISKSAFVYLIEFLLIFCCATGTAFGTNYNDNKSVQSGDYFNLEVSNVDYDYYNYFFGMSSQGNTVITRYGKLPVLETEKEKENWNSTLEELSNKIKDTLASKYMYPHGGVMSCGINAKGYFVILVKYGSVDESLMNEIYNLINNSAKEMSIQDIPVEFGYGTYINREITLDLEKGIIHEFGESTNNLSESEMRALEELMKKKPTIPLHKNIAAYGKIPLLKDQNEIITWMEKLSAIAGTTQDKINPYMKRGQVIIYGVEPTRLEVGINETLPFKEKNTIVKEIYQIINEEARKQNTTDVPVIFDEGIFIDDVATEELGVVEKANLSSSEEKKAVEFNNPNNNNSKSSNGSSPRENESSKTNSTPGFVLFESLICLYGGWKFRKN